jgi:outer membrane immunogenic protein
MKKYMQLSLLSAGVSAAALLLASAAFAGSYKGENLKGEAMAPAVAPCSQEKGLKDGFYVGAQVGYDAYRLSKNYGSTTLNGVALTGNATQSATGFAGGLFAGYGQYFNDAYYLAGEILANASGASQSSTAAGSNTQTVKFNVSSNYGVRVLLGTKLNNSSLLYIPLGYNWANLKAQQAVNGVNYSKSNTSGGFAFGLGLETAVYENFSLRGEFTHTSYNSFNNNGIKNTPYDNQVMVGLVYHFA